jgi:UDP-N-acetylglucosamine acyltransferase
VSANTNSGIDPRASVHPDARIAHGVTVGPFAVIGPDVAVGPGTWIAAHVVIDGKVTIGRDNKFFPFAAIGHPPQDFRYKDEPTEVVIGDTNVFREHCTVHRGTPHGGGITRIGNNGYFMVGAHIAHDNIVGDHVLMVNAATLAGHVEVAHHAVVGAYSGVHQFCRVGPYAFIGGYSVVTRDALPFCTTVGNRARCYGINRIGMKRMGTPTRTVAVLDAAVRELFRPGPSRADALAAVEARWSDVAEVKLIVDFVRGSRRGVVPIRLGAEWKED